MFTRSIAANVDPSALLDEADDPIIYCKWWLVNLRIDNVCVMRFQKLHLRRPETLADTDFDITATARQLRYTGGRLEA